MGRPTEADALEREGRREVLARLAAEKASIEAELAAAAATEDQRKQERQDQRKAAEASLLALDALKVDLAKKKKAEVAQNRAEDRKAAAAEARDREKVAKEKKDREALLNSDGQKRAAMSFSIKKSLI